LLRVEITRAAVFDFQGLTNTPKIYAGVRFGRLVSQTAGEHPGKTQAPKIEKLEPRNSFASCCASRLLAQPFFDFQGFTNTPKIYAGVRLGDPKPKIEP
jgi:hypothetical protein